MEALPELEKVEGGTGRRATGDPGAVIPVVKSLDVFSGALRFAQVLAMNSGGAEMTAAAEAAQSCEDAFRVSAADSS